MTTPTIPQGNKYMDATLYTGTGANLAITNTGGFQPDFVWMKRRDGADSHALYDSVRGVSLSLFSNATNAEANEPTTLTAFNSNGWSIGSEIRTNGSGRTYVGWQWKAGGTAVSNTSGTITSSVSANTTSGFSVVIYTGTGANATVGHGLGVAPSMMIVKCRSNDDWWPVYHSSLGGTKNLRLDDTTAVETISNIWNNTAPTSSVFSIGTSTETGASARTYVAYCWTPIAGYSAFGSYTGNGSADGPFVYLGFRPKFLMVRRTDSTGMWIMIDTSRDPYNLAIYKLAANSSAVENDATIGLAANNTYDLLSNGFKARTSDGYTNASAGTYIYMAFAENSFKYSNAR